MNKMLDREYHYNAAYEFFCIHSCCKYILEYLGVNYGELFLNSAMEMTYAKNEDSQLGFDISMDFQPFLPAFKEKCKIHVPSEKELSYVWNENKIKIDDGIPLILGVDGYYLSYQTDYKRKHGNHNLILCGYSKDEKHASIIDWYPPWYFKGEISMLELNNARSSSNPWDGNINSGIPINNNWVEVDTDGWIAEKEELLIQTIELTLEQYFDNNPLEDCTKEKGIHALKKIYNILLINKTSDEVTRQDLLKNLHLMLSWTTKKKKLFQYYIENSLKQVNIYDDSKLPLFLLDLCKKWETLLLLFLKASFMMRNELYKRILDLFEKIIRHEEELYDMLISLKQKLCR